MLTICLAAPREVGEFFQTAGASGGRCVVTGCRNKSLHALPPLAPGSPLLAAGTAGALDAGLAPGDLFLPTRFSRKDGPEMLPDESLVAMLRAALSAAGLPFHEGRLHTADAPVVASARKAALVARGARAVDMESYGLVAAGCRAGARAAALRVISDRANEDAETDYAAALPRAVDILARALAAVARHIALAAAPR